MEPRTELVIILSLRALQLMTPLVHDISSAWLKLGSQIQKAANGMTESWTAFWDALPPDVQEEIMREG